LAWAQSLQGLPLPALVARGRQHRLLALGAGGLDEDSVPLFA